MLSKDENELLCRTGPGTPMGELFHAGVIALRHRLLKEARDRRQDRSHRSPIAAARIACTQPRV
jgi:hypothetical protein